MKPRIRELLQAIPFRPFVIHIADGRTFRIDYPEFVLASPSNQSQIIVEEPDKDRLHHLSVLLITGIEEITDASLAA